MPLVSVLMAYHRVTPYLRPAVRSILDQTLCDLELVLVDDGTGLGLEPLGEDGRDPRIRLIRQPANLGIAAAHNAAVAAAKGEFIALLDYDDIALPRRLERQVAALQGEPGLLLVNCGAVGIDGEGRILGREFRLSAAASQRAYTQYAAPVVTPAYAGRRELFTRLPYRAEFTFSADFDFLARAAELGPWGSVPETLLQYRHHAGQTTVVRRAAIARERAVVRLLTARRRAGREEGRDLATLLTGRVGEDETSIMGEFAERGREEGFPELAAYHARRLMAVERTPRAWGRALGLFGRTWLRAEGRRGAAGRMFFLGPVRALGLRPD